MDIGNWPGQEDEYHVGCFSSEPAKSSQTRQNPTIILTYENVKVGAITSSKKYYLLTFPDHNKRQYDTKPEAIERFEFYKKGGPDKSGKLQYPQYKDAVLIDKT